MTHFISYFLKNDMENIFFFMATFSSVLDEGKLYRALKTDET